MVISFKEVRRTKCPKCGNEMEAGYMWASWLLWHDKPTYITENIYPPRFKGEFLKGDVGYSIKACRCRECDLVVFKNQHITDLLKKKE